MLNALLNRFAAGKADRRGAQRTRKRFSVAWRRGNDLINAVGVEISEKGVTFASRQAPLGKQIDVVLDLAGRRVQARVAIVRRSKTPRDGAEWTVIAGDYQGIAADDWDAIVRFCNDVPEPTNKAAGELAALARSHDDAYRLLPLSVQERIVATLIAAGRLAPGSDAKNPLLRMSYGGVKNDVHRLTVHSRRNADGEVLLFDSIVTVDDAGNVVLER